MTIVRQPATAPVLYLQDKTSNLLTALKRGQLGRSGREQAELARWKAFDERSGDIIRARWLDEDNKSTLQELADRYGVSAERVRQLEKNAMKKLRAAIVRVISAKSDERAPGCESGGFVF